MIHRGVYWAVQHSYK